MQNEFLQAVVLAIIGSGVLTTIITAIINAFSNRKGWRKSVDTKLNDIDAKLALSEKDALRTQLLIMMSDYPNETSDILKLAQHYFGDLKGNWVATKLFNDWVIANHVGNPEWFNPESHSRQEEAEMRGGERL